MNPASKVKPSPLALDQQLCFALYSASLAMTKLYQPLLAELGLTYPQYLVMLVLWETDGLMVSEMGDRLYLDSGTLTPLLKRLQAQDWVSRVRDKEDERRVRIYLTERGLALRAKALKVPECLMAASGCTVRELSDIRGQINHLRERLTRQAPISLHHVFNRSYHEPT